MKAKKRIAWVLTAAMLMNHATPVLAATGPVLKDIAKMMTTSRINIVAASGSDAVASDGNAVATDGNAEKYISIPDDNLREAILKEVDYDDDGQISVSEILNLTALYAENAGISRLHGLEYAKNLKWLGLANNEIYNIIPLSKLDAVVEMDLSGNKITSVTPIVKMDGLYTVNLSDNRIDSISALGEARNLEWVDLSDNKIEDISALADMSNLLSVELSNNPIMDISPLEGLERLSYCALSGTQITDYSPLASIPNLSGLGLSDNNISDLSFLEELTHLTSINLANNEIEDITPLSNMTKLEICYLNENNISDIKALSGMTAIRQLNLNDNKITDMTPIINLSLLSDFYIQNNRLATVPDCTRLWNLIRDDREWWQDANGGWQCTVTPRNMFGGNYIVREQFKGKFDTMMGEPSEEWLDLNSYVDESLIIPDSNLLQVLLEHEVNADGDDVITKLELLELEYLFANNKGIADLNGLQYAVNLKEIYLDHNEIIDISPLAACTELKELSVRNNKLTNIPDMKAIESLNLYYEDADGKPQPCDIFSGNKISGEEFFDKFHDKLTEGWIYLNTDGKIDTVGHGIWESDEFGWYFLDDNRKMYRHKFVKDQGEIYYVDMNGYMVTKHWVTFSDEGKQVWRYMDESGAAVKSNTFELFEIVENQKRNEFAFDENGIMMTGWVISSENRMASNNEEWKKADYYFNESGVAASGWKEIKVYGGWKGTNKSKDHWFYFNPKTHRKVTWKRTINHQDYYFDPYGAMYSEQLVQIGCEMFWADKNGVLEFKEWNHMRETIPGKEATCTESGLTEGVKCPNHGILVEQEEIPAKGHTEEVFKGYAATCMKTGLTDGKKCSVCGTVTQKRVTIAKKAHKLTTLAGTAASCTEAGLTSGKKCTVCGTVTVEQEEIPANGHTIVVFKGKEATCTASGWTDGKKCSVCNKVTVSRKVIAAKGHTEISVKGKAATCTASGKTDGKKCSACGKVTLAQKTIAAKGHTEVTVKGKAATCTASGLTEGKKCSSCGKITLAQKTIAAKGHKKVTDQAVAATCSKSGLTKGSHCSVCKTVIEAQKKVPATGKHEYQNGKCKVCSKAAPIKAPTISSSNIAASGKVKISWNAVTNASKYQVYRALSKNGNYQLLKTVTATSYTDASAAAGKKYYYKVNAVNANGIESAYSNIVYHTCDLARPVLTTSIVESTGKIKLSWNAVEGAVRYEIYRATSASGTYTRIYTTSKTSMTNANAVAGTKYFYKVRALHGVSAANSAYSEVKNRVCGLALPTITLSNASSGSLKLTWKAVAGADKYEVYRSTSKNGTYSRIATTTKTNFTNSGLKKGTTYYYKIRAGHSKSSVYSIYSTIKSLKAK